MSPAWVAKSAKSGLAPSAVGKSQQAGDVESVEYVASKPDTSVAAKLGNLGDEIAELKQAAAEKGLDYQRFF